MNYNIDANTELIEKAHTTRSQILLAKSINWQKRYSPKSMLGSEWGL